jgi:hypothetical protein
MSEQPLYESDPTRLDATPLPGDGRLLVGIQKRQFQAFLAECGIAHDHGAPATELRAKLARAAEVSGSLRGQAAAHVAFGDLPEDVQDKIAELANNSVFWRRMVP